MKFIYLVGLFDFVYFVFLEYISLYEFYCKKLEKKRTCRFKVVEKIKPATQKDFVVTFLPLYLYRNFSKFILII